MSAKSPKPNGSPKPVKSDIKIKVVPRSSRNQVVGGEGDAFKIKLTSAPVHGMANKTLIEILAKRLGIAKGRIKITSGKTSRLKSVRIYGLSLEEITSFLEKQG